MTTTPSAQISTSQIQIRGARLHNLKNISLDIPRNKMVVITGISGSGKSSLAIDTLHVEGQKKYFQTLSMSVRKQLPAFPETNVDSVTGLPPTLSVSQNRGSLNPRSTLGTVTEIADYLRVLFATAGTVHCPECGRVVQSESAQEIVSRTLNLPERTKLMLLAPVWQQQQGKDLDKLLEKIMADGYVRARVNGELIDVQDFSSDQLTQKTNSCDVEVVIDRIILKPGIEARLQESLQTSLKMGEGQCIVSRLEEGTWKDRFYNERFACAECDISFPNIVPATFSFNSPQGACVTCNGMGELQEEGLSKQCPDCQGSRLNPLASHVTLGNQTLPELNQLSLNNLAAYLTQLRETPQEERSPVQQNALSRIVPEVSKRVEFLRQVGLEYLTLSRGAITLSGGEYQRARLAGCLGSGLTGVCYVLDEPTDGLHARDTQKLLETLFQLRDKGNSLIVIEHDPLVMRSADYLIDLGPGAGIQGGKLIATGTPEEVAQVPESVTAPYLKPTANSQKPSASTVLSSPLLKASGINCHNLQDLAVEIPLNQYVCITGVSGSGKSSLVIDSLVPALKAALKEEHPEFKLQGAEPIKRLVQVDQNSLGRSALSTPATYSGIWDEIRKLYANTREARLRGFKAKRFSFNSPEGRCAACRGLGGQKIDSKLFPEIQITCPTCQGRRFNAQTQSVRYKEKSIADLLSLSVSEAIDFFENISSLHRVLTTFADVGLGYLTLGQSALTLSGGEAQRIKLATELSRNEQPQTLFILDEPSSGLHPADVEHLLLLLRKLVEQGHSVWVIEHQLQMIAAADWIIDIGPEGGAGGGKIVAQGTMEELLQEKDSYTAAALKMQSR